MMDPSWPQNYSRPANPFEQAVYDHLLDCVALESPDRVIERFHKLFIDGTEYSDHRVRASVGKLVSFRQASQEFKFTLNRCCYIPINHWLMQPRLHRFIPELVNQFDLTPSGNPRSRTTQRLRELVTQFRQSEQYTALTRLARVIQQTLEEKSVHDMVQLGGLIHRYPCLYEHTLLTEDCFFEERQRVRRLRRQAQHQFEIGLSHYMAHRQRGQGSALISEFRNPTLLSDRQLTQAVQYFSGRVDGRNTQRDLAQQFLTYTQNTRSYGSFKRELYDYLTAKIDPRYGNRQFNRLLNNHLEATLPDSNDQRMNDVLLVTTCRKLLNFLIVDSAQSPNHFVLSDLTANLGITATIGLLLKVVLLCGRVKCHLEKRFSILFSHYESCTWGAVDWLVEALENLNIALSTNFGSATLTTSKLVVPTHRLIILPQA